MSSLIPRETWMVKLKGDKKYSVAVYTPKDDYWLSYKTNKRISLEDGDFKLVEYLGDGP